MLRRAILGPSISDSVYRRLFASTTPTPPFHGDETRVVRSPHADIPSIPNTSISDIILKRSKSFSGLFHTAAPLVATDAIARGCVPRGISAVLDAHVRTAAAKSL